MARPETINLADDWTTRVRVVDRGASKNSRGGGRVEAGALGVEAGVEEAINHDEGHGNGGVQSVGVDLSGRGRRATADGAVLGSSRARWGQSRAL